MTPLPIGILNNVCYVDGTKYVSIASANADTTNCRVIVVPPKPTGAKYTETLSANFTASATLQGIIFQTDANITMGTNTFTVPSSTTSDGFFLITPYTQSGGFNANAGVRFIYTGSSTPFTFGQTTQRNYNWHVGGFEINIQGATNTITGMQANNLFNSDFSNIQTTCVTSGTQTGMLFNAAGTPGFSDLVNMMNDRSVNCKFPLHLTNTNGYVIYGGASEYNCGNTTSGVGITIDGASGGTNFFMWPDVESCPAFGFDIFNSNNNVFARVESLGGTFVKFESGVTDNYVLSDNPGLTTSTDSSGNARNHATALNGSTWPNGAVPDIFPAFMASNTYGWSGTVDAGGTTGAAGIIGLGRGAGDTAGKFYGGFFNSKSGGQGAVAEVGVHAETFDGGNTLELATNGTINFAWKAGHANQGAATSDYSGKLACAASTVTKTFATAFTSTPVVIVFDETTKGGANLTAISNTAFTVSCTGATDALDYIVVGNPN